MHQCRCRDQTQATCVTGQHFTTSLLKLPYTAKQYTFIILITTTYSLYIFRFVPDQSSSISGSTRRFDYVLTCVILFLCFSVLLALQLPRLGMRELILVVFVRLFDLRLFSFVCFRCLLASEKGCGLWLWHSLDFSLTFFLYSLSMLAVKRRYCCLFETLNLEKVPYLFYDNAMIWFVKYIFE